MESASKQMLAQIARIRKDKELRQHENDDGVRFGEEADLTKLRPTFAGNRGGRGGRRDAQGGRERNYRDREFEGETRGGNRGGRGGAQTAKPGKREKLTDNTDAFPEL